MNYFHTNSSYTVLNFHPVPLKNKRNLQYAIAFAIAVRADNAIAIDFLE